MVNGKEIGTFFESLISDAQTLLVAQAKDDVRQTNLLAM
jgi:hypothetical protein